MDSFDSRYIYFIIGFLAVLALVIYILKGQTKRKLLKIATIVAFTLFLVRKVLFPLGEAWQDKVLGPYRRHEPYTERRYVVKEDMSRYNLAEDGSGGLHPKLLEDKDTWKVLIGEEGNYFSINLSVHNGTVVAKCSPYADGETVWYLLANDSARIISSNEADNIMTVWRGEIKRYSKKTEDGNYEYVFSRVDGLPLTMLQKFFVKDGLPSYIALVIAFAISILITKMLFREKNKQSEEVFNESEVHDN